MPTPLDVYQPGATWEGEIDNQQQAPVFYAEIDGITTEEYSTGPVKSAVNTKYLILQNIRGGGVELDILGGGSDVANVTFEMVDVDDIVTDIVAADAAGAKISTMVNRQVTIYSGFRSIAETSYVPIFVGRITAVELLRDLATYKFTIASNARLLAGDMMANASSTEPSNIKGNIGSVFGSILTGTFSTTGTFPLVTVSSYSAGVSSVPTGLGIPAALIDDAQINGEVTRWYPDAVVDFSFTDSEDAKAFLESEIFRVFQCYPIIGGDGKIGLGFHTQAVAPTTPTAVTETDHIVEVLSWRRLYSDHLNKFRYYGGWNGSSYTENLYVADTSADTTNRTATLETIEYQVESKGLSIANFGDEIASELAGRMRERYQSTPAEIKLELNARRVNLQQGQVVSLTHSNLPNLRTGARGLDGVLMTVTTVSPNFHTGNIQVTLIDTAFKRYGGIWDSASAPKTFASASTGEKERYAFVGDASNNMSDATVGYAAV